ncbi:MAG TPA: CPBP family intramembrane glutamic endopeptidase [Chthoniobacterales bacterium]|nr:CPBP family intramembrane glutamic endopeptidase [Chthoniobacterales bacterium]
MSNVGTPRRPFSFATGLGLFIALFSMLIGRQIVNFLFPTTTFQAAVWKEVWMWVSAAALLLVVRRGEGLPLSSIGLGRSAWWKSIILGVLISLPCLFVGGVVVHLTGYGHGSASSAFDKLPLWLITLIVIRAGVVEEFFYRGYAIERLAALGLGRFWSIAVPLAIFSIGHLTGGWANVLIALLLGAILTFFYLWRRDLTANMIGHGLVDFVGNVLPRLFS